MSKMQSIQGTLDTIDSLDGGTIQNLLVSVAATKDAKATVFVHDRMKKRGLIMSDQCKQALDDLETACRKKQTQELFSVVSESKRTLSAERRIHKICKGSRMRGRHSAAKQHLESAKRLLKENGDVLDLGDSAKARINASKVLSKALSIPLDTARGLVTLLKRAQ